MNMNIELTPNPNYKEPPTSYYIKLYIKYKLTKLAFHIKPLYKLLVIISMKYNYPKLKVDRIKLTDRHDVVIIDDKLTWFTLYDKSYHLGIIDYIE